jgi:RNA polymerase sigma-70 factor (ECF subfamily)
VELLPRLTRAARAWTGSQDEAEDLVQELCVRILARPRLLYGEDELGYLLRALRNTLASERRAAARRPTLLALPDDAPLDDDPAQAAVQNEVYLAIAELADEFREALVAVDIIGLSYQEAARALQVPEGTLTSRLFRARQRLARRLGADD